MCHLGSPGVGQRGTQAPQGVLFEHLAILISLFDSGFDWPVAPLMQVEIHKVTVLDSRVWFHFTLVAEHAKVMGRSSQAPPIRAGFQNRALEQ